MGTGKLKANFKSIGFDCCHCIKGVCESLQGLLFFWRDIELLIAINTDGRDPADSAGRNSERCFAFETNKVDLLNVIEVEKPAILSGHFSFPLFSFSTCFLMSLWPLCVNKCRMASSVVMSFGCFFGFFAIEGVL